MSKEYAKEMEAIKSEVMELAGRLAPGSLLSIGAGKEAITVRLKPNAAELAEKLKESFGATVDITVGFKKFPLDVHFASRLTLHPPQVVDAFQRISALQSVVGRSFNICGHSLTCENMGENSDGQDPR